MSIYFKRMWVFAGEGEDNKKPPADDPVAKALAAQKAEYEKRIQATVDELSAYKARADITTEQRAEFDSQIENLRNTLKTETERAKEREAKLKKDTEKNVTTLTQERDHWKNQFHNTRIDAALSEQAAKHRGVPEQIGRMFRNDCYLAEQLDGEGKPTGALEVKMKLRQKDEKGKPVELDLPIADAFGKIIEVPEFANLFMDEDRRGFRVPRSSNQRQLGPADIKNMSPADYRAARKAGRITI